jgi:Na+/H+ antiporter NhaD/arsenite permease-like protein
MMLGLAYLKVYGFYLKTSARVFVKDTVPSANADTDRDDFDVFDKVARAEWDTLFFFYGVILCVGGLSFIDDLGLVSEFFYGELGATTAKILIGIISAVVDNIPVMFAVLTMNLEMSEAQWLLVTLTAGIGGSLLPIGSAAGVALMGQARGQYTFFSHLKWSPVISLGYAAGITVHLIMSS